MLSGLRETFIGSTEFTYQVL